MAIKLSRQFWKWYLIVAIPSLVICAFLIRRYIEKKFPYGRSHCCSKQLGLALRIYADDHGGAFPSGELTPEASLGLLFSRYVGGADVLRGKTVPLEVTKRALEVNGKLGPESTGWHYVEGLRDSDDPNIVIVWDKVGLGHNGQRIDGGHEVVFVDGSIQYVSRAAWPKLLENQKQLLAARATNSQLKVVDGSGEPKPKKP